jgi:galactonate dehydratase
MDKLGFDLYTYMLNPEFLAIKDGHVTLFDRPGLGVEIDEAKVRQESGKAIPFKNDVVRGENGEVREW